MSGAIIITRPKEDAETLATALTQKGFECIIESVLAIKTLPESKQSLKIALEKKPQAVFATSKHAISAMAEMTDIRAILIIAVGDITATHAQKLGFTNVVCADGTAESIVSFIIDHYIPKNGGLLYTRGEDISLDIAAKLTERHFAIDSVTLYKAEKSRELSAPTCKAILEHKVDSVLFFSQNTANTYAELVKTHHLAEVHNTVTALCLSQAILEKTKTLLTWKDVTLFPPYLKDTTF